MSAMPRCRSWPRARRAKCITATTLLIDHPVTSGWTSTVTTPEDIPSEMRQDDGGYRWLRIDADVPATAEGSGELTVTVTDTYPLVETVSFGTLNADSFLYWSGEAATEDERAFPADAAQQAQAIAGADLRRLIAEQTRASSLVQALDSGSPAYDRFLGQLLETEDAIAAATARAEDARETLVARQAALAALLADA